MKGKKYIVLLVLLLCVIGVFLFSQNNNNYNIDDYECVMFNEDIFTYYLTHESDEKTVVPIPCEKWDLLNNEGDMYVLKTDSQEVHDYYNHDENYNWYVIINDEQKYTFEITKEQLNHLYHIKESMNNRTIAFEEIQCFGDLLKVSKDGLVQGIVNFVKVDNYWYYKTEIMTDNDLEYIIPLSQELNNQLKNL